MLIYIIKTLDKPTCIGCRHFMPEVPDRTGLGYDSPNFCCYSQQVVESKEEKLCHGKHYEPGRHIDYYYVDGTPLNKKEHTPKAHEN